MALNGNRKVTGTLRGFDQFMNIVLDQTVDDKTHTEIGMVVGAHVWCSAATLLPPASHHLACAFWTCCSGFSSGLMLQVVRGNSIVTIEPLDRI